MRKCFCKLRWLVPVVFLRLLLVAVSCDGDVSFLNGSASPVDVTGAVQFQLSPGQQFSFVPSSGDTNAINVAGTALQLRDGALYAVASDGSVSEQDGVLHSAYDDDSVMAGDFFTGLCLGTGPAAILFGILAVRKTFRLGDVVE